MTLQESAENYLEAIYRIKLDKGSVRSIDVAHFTGFSKPSVSRAVGLLRDNDYVFITEEGQLELTAQGLQVAKSVFERHTILTKWLVSIGVSEDTAARDACRIEHVISQESFDKLKKHLPLHFKKDAAEK